MIVRLRGSLLIKEPTRLVVETAGIGFELLVPLSTSQRLPEPGNEVNLFVVTRFTPAGMELFGFFTLKEKEVFELLTSVKGVGPRAALNLLSRFEPEEVRAVITERKEDVLRSVPGIGPKKAAEIIKRAQTEREAIPKIKGPLISLLADAVAALVSLGLSRKEAEDRLRRIQFQPGMSLQEVLKAALTKRR